MMDQFEARKQLEKLQATYTATIGWRLNPKWAQHFDASGVAPELRDGIMKKLQDDLEDAIESARFEHNRIVALENQRELALLKADLAVANAKRNLASATAEAVATEAAILKVRIANFGSDEVKSIFAFSEISTLQGVLQSLEKQVAFWECELASAIKLRG